MGVQVAFKEAQSLESKAYFIGDINSAGSNLVGADNDLPAARSKGTGAVAGGGIGFADENFSLVRA